MRIVFGIVAIILVLMAAILAIINAGEHMGD